MADRVISDKERQLRETYKQQTDDIDRTYTRMGAVVAGELDLLSELWRFVHTFNSDKMAGQRGGYSPETVARLVDKLGYLNHELCRSRDYIAPKARERDETGRKLRAEIDRSRAATTA